MADVAGIMPTVFPEGSRVSDTESSPEIWSDREGFDAAMDRSLLRPTRWLSLLNRAIWAKWGRPCKRWVKAAKGVTTITGSTK